MTALSLVGPSFDVRFKKADQERTINYLPVLIESGQGKGGNSSYLKQLPGLTVLASLGASVRGFAVAREVLYVVSGTTLYEISSAWASTSRGTIAGDSIVRMSSNETQIAIVTGSKLYVYDLDALTLSEVTTNWRGSYSVDVLDGFGIFADPGSNQFYLSANQDFTTLYALDFASAEGSTGTIVSWIVKHRELLILKNNTGEVWYDSGAADFPLARNDGANIEVGGSSVHSLQKIGGVAYWLGRDEQGAAAVFSMSAYQPTRISNHALEEKLAAISDLSQAYAFTFHYEGLTCYVLQVPGLETTPVFEIKSGIWVEFAELVGGDYSPWRCSSHAYVYGVHVLGDSTGKLYKLDVDSNTNAGDTLCRDRITPHQSLPSNSRQRVGNMQIDCDVGKGIAANQEASILVRYSDDGGNKWGGWRTLTLGRIGQFKARARGSMWGAARDRVWQFRVTDDVTCNLLSVLIDEK